MKVGIVTQPLYANYGGILQNYALQQVLKKMGHTPITLDYMPSLSFGRYLLYAGKGLICCLLPSKRHHIKPYRRFLKRPEAIDTFVRNNIDKTNTIPSFSKKVLSKNRIEALIVGSDQVWRYSYNSNCIQDMYLAFAKDYPCRKIAYGASIGVDNWDYPESASEEAKELIKQFDAVSVRENSSKDLCEKYLYTYSEVVLDPTLLLHAEDYELFCHKLLPDSTPYLASYILDINDEKKRYVENVAKARGLVIKDMTVSENGVSIEEWLTTIKNAEFVITDSYHGSLFSIIFEKQFQTIVNNERGADRFLTIFNELDLLDSLIYAIPDKPDTREFDFIEVKKKLDSLINNSTLFLQSSFN